MLDNINEPIAADTTLVISRRVTFSKHCDPSRARTGTIPPGEFPDNIDVL